MAAVFAAVLGAPAAASAQMAVGLKGGVRWAGLRSDQEAEAGTGIVAGGYVGFGVADQLALQFEIDYGVRSFSGLGVGANAVSPDAIPSELQMSYLEVPLLLRVGFPRERVLPSFFAGPYVGFLLSCDLRPEGGESRSCDDATRSEWFDPRGTDAGIVLGGSVDFAMGDGSFFVDVRYGLGLLSIHDDDAISANHGGLDFTGGFAFPIGR